MEELWDRGRLVVAGALQSVRTSTMVRVRRGKLFVAYGPFAETVETLEGFFLIEATDLNDAIHLASKRSWARLGGIGVRPIETEPRKSSRYL